jgi:uncharacterized membrane-anchored protein
MTEDEFRTRENKEGEEMTLLVSKEMLKEIDKEMRKIKREEKKAKLIRIKKGIYQLEIEEVIDEKNKHSFEIRMKHIWDSMYELGSMPLTEKDMNKLIEWLKVKK